MASAGKNALLQQVDRIKTNVANSYIRAEQKGATMPTEKNSDNLPDTIASIPTGGSGGNFEKMYVAQSITNDTCTLSLSSSGDETNAKIVGQVIIGENGKIYMVEV